MEVGHYSFYGNSDPRRKKSWDNELGFLEYKEQYDKNMQKKLDDEVAIKPIKEPEKKITATEAEDVVTNKQESDLEKKPPTSVVSSLTDETIFTPYNSTRKHRRHQLQRTLTRGG